MFTVVPVANPPELSIKFPVFADKANKLENPPEIVFISFILPCKFPDN